jgi:hypothetical protein
MISSSSRVQLFTETSTIRAKLPKLFKLRTLSLLAEKVEDIIRPAASALLIPTSELLERQPLRILVAPSGFKESLGPEDVAHAVFAKSSMVHRRSYDNYLYMVAEKVPVGL